jgi:hypothetical protein
MTTIGGTRFDDARLTIVSGGPSANTDIAAHDNTSMLTSQSQATTPGLPSFVGNNYSRFRILADDMLTIS